MLAEIAETISFQPFSFIFVVSRLRPILGSLISPNKFSARLESPEFALAL